MTIKTFQIFKPGTHTTAAGQALTFTPGDLHAMAAAFSEDRRPAPLVLGHPQTDSPAEGWVKALTYSEGHLYATADFQAPLVEKVKAGRYRNVSAAFLTKNDARNPTPGTWYLRHVGFLGAMPPAVKGLEPVAFCEFAWLEADGATVISAMQPAVAFSEGEADDPAAERAALHDAAQLLMTRNPGMSYATAAQRADQLWEQFKAQFEQQREPSARVAFHEAVLDFQGAVPGVTYAQAVSHLQPLLRSIR